MRAKLRKAILKMLDECPKCKGKGKRPRWIAIENGISTGKKEIWVSRMLIMTTMLISLN